jgi:hypothetical protein
MHYCTYAECSSKRKHISVCSVASESCSQESVYEAEEVCVEPGHCLQILGELIEVQLRRGRPPDSHDFRVFSEGHKSADVLTFVSGIAKDEVIGECTLNGFEGFEERKFL